MPEFIANGLIHSQATGKTAFYGERITLTTAQAEKLGNRVIPVEVAEPSKPLKELTVKELRPLAKAAGVEAYSTKDRAELIAALESLQVEQVKNDAGSASD